jgi:hypothetical protein
LTQTHSAHQRSHEVSLTDTDTIFQAEISRTDFWGARLSTPALLQFPNYAEWFDEREALEIGLAAAGVNVIKTPISLALYRGRGAWLAELRDVEAIDALAARVAAFRLLPQLPCSAELSAQDFRVFGSRMEACKRFPTYESWRRHRERVRDGGIAGIHRLAVDIASFMDWTSCLSLPTTETNLDNFARLSLECLSVSDGGV